MSESSLKEALSALGSDRVLSIVGAPRVDDPVADVPFVPSGGVGAGNSATYLRAGALAVTAGTSVVSPADVADGRWDDITSNARAFCAELHREGAST